MDGGNWWLAGWLAVTVLGGIGAVLRAPREERADVSLSFFGVTVLIVGTALVMWVFGWWPR